MDSAQRDRVAGAIPPRKCKAVRSRDGRPCGNWAVVGPQVHAAAQRRIILAEALTRGDRRPAAEVLTDAIHIRELGRGLNDGSRPASARLA